MHENAPEIILCYPNRPLLTLPPPPFQASWRTEAVQALLKGILEEKAFDRLPILADALEEAGCDDEHLLRHCREGLEHDQYCWAIAEVEGIQPTPEDSSASPMVNLPPPDQELLNAEGVRRSGSGDHEWTLFNLGSWRIPAIVIIFGITTLFRIVGNLATRNPEPPAKEPKPFTMKYFEEATFDPEPYLAPEYPLSQEKRELLQKYAQEGNGRVSIRQLHKVLGNKFDLPRLLGDNASSGD